MARQQLTLAAATLAALVALFSFVAYVDAAGAKEPGLPPPALLHKYKTIRPGKRNQVLTCIEPTDKGKPCVATCPNRCPEECLVMCATCTTYCRKQYNALTAPAYTR